MNDFYDVDLIRADFPILSSKINGHPLVYLDNAASAQKPLAVINAVCEAYKSTYANVHRSSHSLSNAATRSYEDSREAVRKFLHARSKEEIIFTSGATAAINIVAYGYGMPFIGEGGEILLSVMEHHSNIVPWHFLRECKGAKLVWVPVDDNGIVSIEDFERLLTPRVKLVAITHMSNVLGTVTPIKDIVRLAQNRGVPVLVDGSQAVVHMPVNVEELDCDFYVFTGHKVYGPTGVGVLYGKKHRLEAMHPFHGGGEMIRDVTQDNVTYEQPPWRFEAGTPPIVQAIGLGAALAYIESCGREKIAAHEADLTAYAHERLGAIRSLRILGNSPSKAAIVSFDLKGVHPHDISILIDRKGIAIRAGTHCAQPLLDRFGFSSVCRASFAMYNKREEIDLLADALEESSRFFSRCL